MVSASRRKPSQISGFTLVELLVVITIIGILMGLLIPAVQAAREAARRNQCSTQINNLAKATIQEEMAKKQYPGWINSFGKFEAGPDPSDPESGNAPAHAKVGGWAVTLLPYLDAQPIYEIWTQSKYPVIGANGYTANAAPNLAILQCPSSSTIESTRGRNSYISNNGMSHVEAPVTFEQSMGRANGIFNAKLGTPEGPAVRSDDIKDGLGNTVLFSENLQAQPWHQLLPGAEGNTVTAVIAGETATLVLGSRFAQGMVWHYRDPKGFNSAETELEVHRINGVPLSTDTAAVSAYGSTDLYGMQMPNSDMAAHIARPSSAHSGGVNMGFADGGSRFVVQTIDYRVYQAIMTPRGKSSSVPFTEYVLPGDAL
jgi:prepilin-type N-terminal cleavage/methylation domain-containing protein/prepilin-type processing-associated H-X9-DG protein